MLLHKTIKTTKKQQQQQPDFILSNFVCGAKAKASLI